MITVKNRNWIWNVLFFSHFGSLNLSVKKITLDINGQICFFVFFLPVSDLSSTSSICRQSSNWTLWNEKAKV